MTYDESDIESSECTACYEKSVDVRIEVLTPTDEDRRENRTTKIIIYRCKKHLSDSLDEILRLSSTKKPSL